MVLLSSQWYLATMDFERLRHIPCTCDWCAISFNLCRSSHWHLVAMVNMIPSNITKVSQPSMIIIDNLCIYIYAKHKWSTYDVLWKVDLALGSWHRAGLVPARPRIHALQTLWVQLQVPAFFFPGFGRLVWKQGATNMLQLLVPVSSQICFVFDRHGSSLRTALLPICPTSAVINSQGERTQILGLIP